jgi:hypothetical protein
MHPIVTACLFTRLSEFSSASRIVHKFCCLGLCLCPAALCAAQMRHLAVYMMLVLGGNATPSKEDVTKALSTVGIEADEARLDHLLSELEGKVCYY